MSFIHQNAFESVVWEMAAIFVNGEDELVKGPLFTWLSCH